MRQTKFMAKIYEGVNMKRMILFLASILLLGCNVSGGDGKSDLGENASNEKNYIIEDLSGNEVLSFKVDADERIVSSRTKDSFGVEYTRNYSYNGENLESVKVIDSYGNSKNLNYFTTLNRANGRVEGKVIVINGKRGETEKINFDYYYDDEDGELLGILSYDENGNEYVKGATE